MTRKIDFVALSTAEPALAAFVTEAQMVVGFTGTGGIFVAWRPFDDEDIHICTLRDKPTRVLLQVVLERDANWKDRAAHVARLLAEGTLRPTVDGAHLIIDERQLTAPPPLEMPTPHPPPPTDRTKIDFDDLQELCPPFAEWLPESNFVVGFNGPGGLFVVTRPTSDTYILAPRGDERLYVFLETETDEEWDHERAQHVARMLATGVLVARPKDGHFVLDEATLASHELTHDDLERWPLIADFVTADAFVAGFHGPGGVYVVYKMGSHAGRAFHELGIEFRHVAIITMRGHVRELVWLLLDDPQGWSAPNSAVACAWALAHGVIGTLEYEGSLVVDEFDADKAVDAY